MEFFSPFFRIYTCNFHQTRKYLAIWLRSRPEAFPLHWPELIRHVMKSPFIKQAPISFDKRIKPMNIPLPIIKKIKKKTAKELDIPSNPSHSLLR